MLERQITSINNKTLLFKYLVDQKIDPAWEEILGQSSDASLATGPVIALPLV